MTNVVALVRSWSAERINAAAFCLRNCGHTSGVVLTVQGKHKKSYAVKWRVKHTEKLKRTFGDHQVAAELGAEGMAALLIERHTGHRVHTRTFKGPGFDYYIGPDPDPHVIVPVNAGRLEISGIMKSSDTVVRSRVKQKQKQTRKSKDLKIPAFVIVSEFGTPQSHVQKGQ